MNRRTFLLAAVLVLPGAPGRAGDTQTELWPEAQAFFRLGERLRLHLLADVWYAPRSWTADGAASDSEAEVGAHFDVTLKPIVRPRLRTRNWERERYAWARVGYDYLWAPGGEQSHEHRGIVEVTGRVRLPGGLWAINRARVDLRDKNGEQSSRYRDRVTLERETALFGLETIPYASVEFLYDTRYDAWSEQRYQLGLEAVLDPRWRLESYYQRKEDQRSAPAHTHAIGLVVRYYH
jgi:hypothetical protein